MMTEISLPVASHGGLLIPLDAFRVSHLAGIIAELLVSKARNIVDAQLVVVRHPASPLVLARIEGSVVGDDPADFWRENADIALAASQVLPRQCFLYYARTEPADERREGFVVAQRGQVAGADDATAAQQPPDQPHWPVEKLCEQLRLSLDELAAGFVGGPRVETSLVEPTVDDQAAYLTLVGQSAEPVEPDAGAPAQGDPAAPAGAPAKPKETVADDLKRRETERAADAAAAAQRSDQIRAELGYEIDDLGIVLMPTAELAEADVLAPMIVPSIGKDPPPGVPPEHVSALQGKRCDVALRVDFLSEVFVESTPLAKPVVAERAETQTIGGREVQVLEVLAPRLGYGTLVTTGRAPHVYVSRKPDLPLPADVIGRLLE